MCLPDCAAEQYKRHASPVQYHAGHYWNIQVLPSHWANCWQVFHLDLFWIQSKDAPILQLCCTIFVQQFISKHAASPAVRILLQSDSQSRERVDFLPTKLLRSFDEIEIPSQEPVTHPSGVRVACTWEIQEWSQVWAAEGHHYAKWDDPGSGCVHSIAKKRVPNYGAALYQKPLRSSQKLCRLLLTRIWTNSDSNE